MTKNTKLAKLIAFMVALAMMLGSFPGGYNVTYVLAEGEEEVTVDADPCANGHAWDGGTVTREATCTEAGELTYTCSNCGTTTTESIPAAGHTEVADAGYAPTCTEAGLTDGSHCSVCGEVLVAQEVIPANGHSLTETPATEATATHDGTTAYWTCSVCGKYFSDANGSNEISANSWIIEGSAAQIAAEEAAAQAAAEEAAAQAEEEESVSEPEETPEPEATSEPQPEPIDVSDEIGGEPAPELETEEEAEDEDDWDDWDEDWDDEWEEYDEDDLVIMDDWDFGSVSEDMLEQFSSTSDYEQMEFNGNAEIDLINEGTLRFGDEITLEAKVQDANLSYRLIWEANDKDDRGWYTVASGEQYSYTLTQDNYEREYRVVLYSVD